MPHSSAFQPIYLDHHATTPVDERVLAAMLPYFTEFAGNPASNHCYGWQAEGAIAQAREQIAAAINAVPEEIIFTSGATEANNLAIKGVAEAYLQRGRHLITVQTEHSAVLEPCRYLESVGFRVTYLPVQQNGLIDLSQLEQAFCSDTILVSVMAANNEIGVLQPLAEIGQLCRQRQVLFHTDAAQAIAKISLDVESLHIDLMSLTAHKIYGPKGIGALYVRRHRPKVNLAPQLHGGDQEQGLRSGTLPTPLIIGFGKAVELGLAEQVAESQRLTALRQHLLQRLSVLEGIHLNGHPTQRLPGCLNVSFEDVDGAALLLDLQEFAAVSSGSACNSAHPKPSHVLLALGHSPQLATASIRFSLGHSSTLEQIEQVAERTMSVVRSLRNHRSG
jgi:cysteine desulfurase